MVGTSTAFVTRSRSTTSSTASGTKSRTRIVVAPSHSPRNAQPIPPTWNIGSGVMLTVAASNAQSGDEAAAAARLRWVVRTPFGTPVVPDVYICNTASRASPRTPGSIGSCAASSSSYVEPVGTTGVPVGATSAASEVYVPPATTARGRESASTAANSGAASRQLSGTATAP